MEIFDRLMAEFKSRLNNLPERSTKAEVAELVIDIFGKNICNASYVIEDSSIFQAILDTIPVPVYYKNTNGIYLACNKALCDVYKLRREDIVGKTSYDFFPKETADSFSAGDRLLIKERTEERLEHRGQFPGMEDGFHIIHKTAYIRDGEVEGIIGVITDMTEQKMIEDRAWASEAFFKSLFETSPMPIVLINSFNIIVDLNTTAEKFFYGSETLAGQEASNLFCTYGDYERAMTSSDGIQRVNIYNNVGIKQEVITMRSASELNGEVHYAVAFVRMDF